MKKISIIGSGAWGTALGVIANRAGAEVTLWTRNEQLAGTIHNKNVNDIYLPGIFIDPAIRITTDLAIAAVSDLIVLAVPAQSIRATCIALSDRLHAGIPLLIAAKGIERGSLSLMSEVVSGILPGNPVAVLSGPNLALEIAQGKPAAATIASTDRNLVEQIAFAIGSTMFRPYYSPDLVGTQIGGAVKNVIAIACGIAIGKKLGENARSALVTRGLSEILRLCVAKGGQPETLMGLSGIGDLVLTCTSQNSRNLSFGIGLGTGYVVDEILSKRQHVTEGVTTVEGVCGLARNFKVDMPICNAIMEIIHNDADITEVIHSLMQRPFTDDSPASHYFRSKK